MGGKQLDFNAPLLSVRRFSSKLAPSDEVSKKSISTSPPNLQHSLPLYQPDCGLGEVTNPAAVPFLWEQIPGRPKGSEVQLPPPEELPAIPSLTQGKVLDVKRHVSGERCDYRNVTRAKVEASSLCDHATLLCILNEDLNVKGDSDLESGDDIYSDALDALSLTESFSLKCSLGGVSRNDVQDVKLSETFDSDPQARDFMMSRFLPAAKAMVLEAPRYVSRKKPLVSQPPLKVTNMVNRERRPLTARHEPKFLSLYSQHTENVESDEDEAYDYIGKKLTKICGFFPRFCVKNSLSLLNPVPRMKLRMRTTVSSACEVRRPARTAYSGPLFRHNYDATHKKKFHSGVLSREVYEHENKKTGEPYQFSYSKDAPSFHRNFRSGGIAPYRNQALQSPFHHGARFLGTSKKIENIQANKSSSFKQGCSNFPHVSSQQIYKQRSGSVCPTIEKTLYIDPASEVQHPMSNSVSSGTRALKNYSAKNSGMFAQSKGVRETSAAKSFVQDKATDNLRGRILNSEGSASVYTELPSITCSSNFNGRADKIGGYGLHPSLDQKSRSSEYSKVNFSGELDKVKINEHMTKDDKEISRCGSLQSPLTPPLPKSPSESWLWRTLPSIPLRYPFLHSNNASQFHTEKQDQKMTTDKWELVVRTTNTHLDHV